MNLNLQHIDTLLNNSAVGAFFGALFAFMFGIIAYIYTKHREKWVNHHNALVKSEYLINIHLNTISSDIHLLGGSIKTFSKDHFSENELYLLDKPDYMSDFHNINLLNMYFDYDSTVDKVNHDLASWNRSNARLLDSALNSKINAASIDTNRKNLSKRSKNIIQHLEELMQQAYTTLAYIRLFMSVDKRDVLARLSPTESIKLTKKEVEIERKRVVNESKKTMKEDRVRIEKIKKQGNI